MLYFIYGKEPQVKEIPYYREPPTDEPPALVGMLFYYQNFHKRFISATILHFIHRKIIQYEAIVDDPNDFRLTWVQKDIYLHDFEKTMLQDILFRSKQDTITIKELQKKIKRYKSVYAYPYHRFRTQLQKNAKEKNWFHAGSLKASATIRSLGSFLIFATLVLFAFSPSYLLLGLPTLLYCIFARNLRKRSIKGKEEFVKWKAFQQFLLDFSNLEHYEADSIIIWKNSWCMRLCLELVKNTKSFQAPFAWI